MGSAPQAPLDALTRWVSQLRVGTGTGLNSVRRVEKLFDDFQCTDTKKSLRGLMIAKDLVITRKWTFYRLDGKSAIPMSAAEVAAMYPLETLQQNYRAAVDEWKASMRRRR